MKRTLILRVAALMLCILFACSGCGNKSTDNTGSTESKPVGDSLFSVEKVSYTNAEGEAVYRVVRPDGDKDITSIASSVRQSIKTSIGVNMKSVFDTEDGTDTYEILIGNTNRAESQQAIQYLRDNGKGRYNDYIICTIGKKIVINGMTLDAVKSASEYFVANFVKKEGVEGGMKYVYTTPGDFKAITINGNDISKYTFIRDLTNRSWLIQNEVNKIQQAIKDKSGFILELKEDKTTAEGEYEIIIGNTTRAGVTPQSEYGADEYEIRISGKKVFIMGGSTHAVQVAVTEFGKILEKETITDADSKKGSYTQTIKNYDSKSYYRLVWGDDFNGSTVDSKWYFANNTNPGSEGAVIGVKNDLTCEVSNGNLIMRAFQNDGGGYTHCNGADSSKFMHFNMGYIELRARIPDGKGVYSSFWLINDGQTTERELLEIDIFESLGNPGRQSGTIHKWRFAENGGHFVCDKEENRDFQLTNGSLFDEYRTVGLLWTETEVVFYYDGMEYYRHVIDDDYFMDKYLKVLFGFNVGWKDRTRPGTDLEWPLEYHVDYIRLYQVDGQNLILN